MIPTTVTELDQAYGKRLIGDRDGALRLALAIYETNSDEIGALALIARLLSDAGRVATAAAIAARLVDSYMRRGDLPSATASALLAEELGNDGAALRTLIAETFGKGSEVVGAPSMQPPPLPTRAKLDTNAQTRSGPDLIDYAENVVAKVLAERITQHEEYRVPMLPLFGALKPRDLVKLLGAMTLRELDTGAFLIRQGEAGQEAFVLVRGLLHAKVSRDGQETLVATLGPGSVFGEMALVCASPRAASVVAQEPAQVLVVSRDALEELARAAPPIGEALGRFCHDRMIGNLLKTSSLLKSVATQGRGSVLARFKTLSFKQGDVLLKHGQDATGLFLIASGTVAVIGRDADGDQVQLAILGPGDVVGEISLVLRRPVTADVIAQAPTVALGLGREEFMLSIREVPALLAELYELATRREDETRTASTAEAVDVGDEVLL